MTRVLLLPDYPSLSRRKCSLPAAPENHDRESKVLTNGIKIFQRHLRVFKTTMLQNKEGGQTRFVSLSRSYAGSSRSRRHVSLFPRTGSNDSNRCGFGESTVYQSIMYGAPPDSECFASPVFPFFRELVSYICLARRVVHGLVVRVWLCNILSYIVLGWSWSPSPPKSTSLLTTPAVAKCNKRPCYTAQCTLCRCAFVTLNLVLGHVLHGCNPCARMLDMSASQLRI